MFMTGWALSVRMCLRSDPKLYRRVSTSAVHRACAVLPGQRRRTREGWGRVGARASRPTRASRAMRPSAREGTLGLATAVLSLVLVVVVRLEEDLPRLAG